MHTTIFHKTRFHYNSDFSGSVFIHHVETDREIEIPGKALLDFAALIVRDAKISALEQMETDEILRL